MASPSSSRDKNLENVDVGGVLPVLNWSEHAFQTLILNFRMSADYGAQYPTEGQTAVDAPTGHVTLFADFFQEGNIRLPLTVFMVDLLEYYRIHISQLSSLGMVCARHFEYYFRPQGLEPTVKHFRRFYQLLEVQSVFQHIPKEMLTITTTQELYETFQALLLVAVRNRGLISLCKMMRWKTGSRQKPVCWENVRDKFVRLVIGLWCMFAVDNEVKTSTEPCDNGEAGWHETVIGNFRIPERLALEAPISAGPGTLCYLLLNCKWCGCAIPVDRDLL
ncbi:hypothetical protein HanPI659440_Chr14g0546261 [Helianthus annuus]|nr:hypothetical protein HanPI659440_Chr14g0546261 [Helianthus annuus]